MKNFDQIIASEPPIEGTETEDEFYEDMEAPKFVDLTVPDNYHPDDRYWFCSRVGCDQKHEEELNWEEINKNFVLRVMAARSPNIKIRKMLTKNSPTLKFPQTVPAKPAKSRISRLAVASSISRKLIYAKDKTKPLSKLTTTPKANSKKTDPVASKAFTTPRNNRKRVSNNNDGFRSVWNPKSKPSVALPKANNKVITKGLVFGSPKKVKVKVKTSVELKTQVGKLCAAMKKLEIATGKKRLLETKTPVGKLCAAMSKLELASAKKNPTFLLPLDRTVRKQLRGREVKSRVFDSLKKVEGKKRGRRVLEQSSDPKEINEKSKLNVDVTILSSSKEDSEEKLESSAVKMIGLRDTEADDKENDLPSITIPEDESEVVNEIDEKENTSASDINREPSGNSGKNILAIHDLKNVVVKQVTKKPLKKSSIVCATSGGTQEAKYRKPKPTNPKPFRLRTDERGILKESTLEKKLVTPLREITTSVKPKSSRKIPTSSQENIDENVRRQIETRMDKADVKPEKTTSITRTKTTTACKSSERTTRFSKSLEKPQGIGSTRKTVRLGVIKERAPSESGPRSVSRGRTTIPREPNFHTIHVPKSCTKRVP